MASGNIGWIAGWPSLANTTTQSSTHKRSLSVHFEGIHSAQIQCAKEQIWVAGKSPFGGSTNYTTVCYEMYYERTLASLHLLSDSTERQRMLESIAYDVFTLMRCHECDLTHYTRLLLFPFFSLTLVNGSAPFPTIIIISHMPVHVVAVLVCLFFFYLISVSMRRQAHMLVRNYFCHSCCCCRHCCCSCSLNSLYGHRVQGELLIG